MTFEMKQSPEKLAKALLIKHLLEKKIISEDVVIINELALELFSRRVDIALVNGNIDFFEVKSEADNLDRLPGQIEVFSRFCDKLYIVGAPCHIQEILLIAPDDIAVWQLDVKSGIKIIRDGKSNLLFNRENLLKLINVQELRQILIMCNVRATSYRRKFMEEAIADLNINNLRSYVITMMKKRYMNTTEQFLKIITKDFCVNPENIVALKREKLPSYKYKIENVFFEDIYLKQLADQTKEIFGSMPDEIKSLINFV